MNNIINPIVEDNLLQISDENSNICSLSPDSEQCTCDIPEPPFNIKLRPSINFYKGTSFRWRREWEPGCSYINDDYHIDLVYHKGKSWICTESHVSNAENAPSENVSVWELVVNQSGSGIHVGPEAPTEEEYGDLATKMLWLDTDEEDDSLRVYSTDQTYNKSEVDNRIKEAAANASADAKAYADGLVKDAEGNALFDAAGAAATAEQNAKDYADGLASNYDAAGSAAAAIETAAADAQAKADAAQAAAIADAAKKYQKKGNYEPAGSAAAAETAAKKYADGLASNYDKKGAAGEALATAKLDASTKANTALTSAKTYTDAEIAKLSKVYDVKGTAADFNAAMDKRVVKLESIDHTQLAKDASAAAVATVLDGAPEAFDTLKEVAQWISDSEAAAEAADLITRVSNLESGKVDKVKGKNLSTNDFTDADKLLVDTIPNLASKNDYYPKMSVGMADNLVGRGDTQDAQINFRPSAGADNITDGAARIERIKGNSVVWNQLLAYEEVKSMDTNDLSVGCWFVRQGENNAILSGKSLTINFVATRSSFPNMTQRVNFVTGYKYLFYIKYKLNGEPNSYGVSFRISSSPDQVGGNNTVIHAFYDLEGESSFIYTADRNNPYVYINPAKPTNDIGQYLTVECTIIDLTQMFGAGNEPTTVEEYLQRKPMNIEDEYAYNEGELIDMKVDSLISTSDNAYDYVEGYARVMGGHTYDCSYGTAFVEKVYFSTNKDNIVAEENAMTSENGEYTFPSDGYAVPYTTDGDVREYCVCLQHTYTKPHPVHQQDVKDLSFIGEAFSEGMRSAGSAFDEIRFNKTTKKWEKVTRIGVVDLGSLNWRNDTYNGQSAFVNLNITDSKGQLGWRVLTNSLLIGYTQRGTFSDLVAEDNKVYVLNPTGHKQHTFAIRDTSYTDAIAFKQAMQEQGVKLYYELAEPIVEEIEGSENWNLDYLVWDFGTEEAIASVPSAPFRADINYSDNFVDDIRKNTSALNSKQNTLTLTTKPNGNIVIGNLAGQTKEFMPATPSGDPMHYAYEAVGAVYNDTNSDITLTGEYGDTITHKAHHWLLNEIGDMTNDDMRTTITTPLQRSGTDWSLALVYNDKIRTFLSLSQIVKAVGWYGTPVKVNMEGFVNNDTKLEVVKLYKKPQSASDDGIRPQKMSGAFTSCLVLRKVIGILDWKDINASQNTVFSNCNSLEEIRMKNLKVSSDFHWSPLSVASAIYLLQNADATAQFTITFRADRQAIYEANADFMTAKSAKPNITILYQ